MAASVAQLRHSQWGLCQLVRVEATDWIVRVGSTGVLYRVRSESRAHFEVIRDKTPPFVAPHPPIASVTPNSPAARNARRAIESLRVGLPSLDGTTRQLAIGFDQTDRMIRQFLRDVDDDGGGAMVLKGAYGQGKTFALTVLEEIALESRFVTTRMEIDATENRLNKPHHIFRSLMQKLRVPGDNGPGVHALVSKAVELLAKHCPGDVVGQQQWLSDQLGCRSLGWLLSDPAILQKPQLLGLLECDANCPAGRARGCHCNPPTPRIWPAFSAGTQGDFASFILSGVGRLTRLLGFQGLIIILDEMEKWHELNWLEQSRAGNLLVGLIWGATAPVGQRGKHDQPRVLQHSLRCGGYPFTTEQPAYTGVAIAMTPREEAIDPERTWCQYGAIRIGDVPRFNNRELNAYSRAVVPVFATAFGLAPPNNDELMEAAEDALSIWRQHGDLTTRSGVQAVIAAFDKWRDRKHFAIQQ